MMKSLTPFLILGVALSTLAALPQSDSTKGGFLIDPSKHYVYLKFGHVGDREPLSHDESPKGLWLELVNNCKVPILVAVFNSENNDQELGVYHDVVPVPTKKHILEISGFPKPGHKTTTPDKEKSTPKGYLLPDVFSTTRIPPGESLHFSVPLNHVDPRWSLEIRFYLDLPGDSYGSGPYSVVSFDWQDIPEKFRHVN